MRLLVGLSHFFEDAKNPKSKGTCFLLRRTQGNIVPYCRALMMAVPGNHMFSLMPEMSRYIRERYIWQLAKEVGKEVGIPYYLFHYLFSLWALVLHFATPTLACPLAPSQVQEPILHDPDVQGAVVTEYTVKYSLKDDNTKRNDAFITSSFFLQDLTKTDDQRARSVLARAMNRITGSMTLGAIYVTHLLLGHGDSYLSYDTQIINFVAYVRHFYPAAADRLFPSSASSQLMQRAAVNPEDGSICLVDEVMTFNLKNKAIASLSPVELAMTFQLTPHPESKPHPLQLDSTHPMAGTHGHRQRSKFVVPQFLTNPPPRPDSSAPLQDKEDYAAYALSVFFNNEYLSKLPEGTLWEKLEAWREGRCRPRSAVFPGLDEFAVRMLTNVENQAAARLVIRHDAAFLKASRAAAKAAAQAQQVRNAFMRCLYLFPLLNHVES